MTIEQRIEKLRYLITCMKCEVNGKSCDINCPTQYYAGNMGEIIENLEEIATILDLKCAAKTHLNSIYGTMVTDSIYCDTDSIKKNGETNDKR